MSVLIKGMQMPKCCMDCFACHVLSDEGLYCEPLDTDIEPGYFGRLDNCPLTPVPPHGNLIDRDALIDTATIHWSQTTNESCFPIDEIEYAPTIIPADGKDTDVPTREEGE